MLFISFICWFSFLFFFFQFIRVSWAHRHHGRHCCCSPSFPYQSSWHTFLWYCRWFLLSMQSVFTDFFFCCCFFSRLFLLFSIVARLNIMWIKATEGAEKRQRWNAAFAIVLFVSLFVVFCLLCSHVIYPVFNTNFSLFIQIIVIILGTIFVVVCVRACVFLFGIISVGRFTVVVVASPFTHPIIIICSFILLLFLRWMKQNIGWQDIQLLFVQP